jgi:hypothetical protein
MFPGCRSLTRTPVVVAAEVVVPRVRKPARVVAGAVEVAVEAEEVPAGETRWRPASR